jgi:Asp-tRNA(Asn)/Glu-tRNA(Gln) amidotransferase A subunit family amidase
MSEVDILATPTLPVTAPPYGSSPDVMSVLSRLTAPMNAAGLPALAVPCGFGADTLPASLQLVGRPFDEATVLRAGQAFQQRTDWHTKQPPLTI